jgi:uncharacterized RDD family membrane protein YckC
MDTSATDQLRYAGFWPRLGALLLDVLILSPMAVVVLWGDRHWFICLHIVGPLFGFFYSVFLVQQYGGTPGKLILGVRIRKVTGEPVGYREAFLRYFPEFTIGILSSIAILISVFSMNDTEYQALPFMDRSNRIIDLAPSWYNPLQIMLNIWVWGELIVLLTNKKRRALHDFIAGTVVIRVGASGGNTQSGSPQSSGFSDAL